MSVWHFLVQPLPPPHGGHLQLKLESIHGDLAHRLNAAIPCGVPQVMSHSVVHS